MKSPDEIKKGLECLDKMQFFMGQRAGRELWMEKPKDVQDSDLEQYNRDVDTVRAFIQQLQADKIGLLESSHEIRKDMLARIHQLETERDAAVAGLKSNCTCTECKYFSDDIQEPCRGCKPNTSQFEWRGVQKEE